MANSKSTYEIFEAESEEHRKLLRQEELILAVTEELASALADAEMTQSELARKLGSSKSYVSQLMAGGRNLTLRTLSNCALALNVKVELKLEPRSRNVASRRKHASIIRIDEWSGQHREFDDCHIIEKTASSDSSGLAA